MERLIGKLPFQDHIVCPDCADLDYSRVEILKLDISEENRRTGFKYPQRAFPGSPEPPTERPVGDHVTHLRGFELTYEFLRKALWFAFYNFHYREYTKRQPTAETSGWFEYHLKAYCSSCAFSEGIVARLKRFSAANVGVSPADLEGRFESEVIPSTWRLNVGIRHNVDPIMHCIVHGVLCQIFDLVASIYVPLHIKK